ncbi:hypothetical protein A1O1_01648 [Capronia coronata CBS 617.96]|uniref:N-acetyl-D-glucosamine kinase n=1 Tax=Capronia coronata CBS 617.96 TaxID=1182541 RepID=W9YUD7_9EURO|nr:uncharacterized protein A1O1_01648 [Capronia coronata CBS 617.96]EXJ96522.1 hypothetical protein A1O1_01648 [Capronia coronata CBS 617.96]
MIAQDDLACLQTEERNPKSFDIDQVSTVELCQIINHEDATIATAVSRCIPVIAAAIDVLARRVRRGGRVIYVGAGTSGRLGVLDASEIPPTYSAPEGQFIGLIAGGDVAIRHAQEGAEDDVDAAVQDLQSIKIDGRVDSVVGIATSGRTPYVLSSLSFAKSLGCASIGVACVEPSAMSQSEHVDFMISPVVGAEVVTGSTRMKAGTATKMVLNMLSTGTMIRIGKTYGNMMVDLKATNLKLRQRARNILRSVCGPLCPNSDTELDALLDSCGGSVKLAIAKLSLGLPVSEAQERLTAADGVLSKVLQPASLSPELGLPHEARSDFVLCVDGGGSKCAAAVISLDGTGTHGYGEAGGCNVTDVGVDKAIAEIELAVQRACCAHPQIRGRPWKPSLFATAWVALAGYDRKEIAIAVDQTLEALFQRPIGNSLKVTNDTQLLATSAAGQGEADSVVVLVAGTGSVAMCYQRDQGRLVRTGRSNGWGYLLGDDGSGFDMGRQAIRAALLALDKCNLENHVNGYVDKLPLLVQRVLQYFQPKASDDARYDLLGAVLSSASELDKKKLIASVARIVIELSGQDQLSRDILDNSVRSLTNILLPIVTSRRVQVEKSILVLAGGLMQSDIFVSAVKSALLQAKMSFKTVEVVQNPALSGAMELVRQVQESC